MPGWLSVNHPDALARAHPSPGDVGGYVYISEIHAAAVLLIGIEHGKRPAAVGKRESHGVILAALLTGAIWMVRANDP